MSIDELNATVDSGLIDEYIRIDEARQNKALSRIADTITERGGVRLVLLAGGSSAGKTTTAKRLSTQLAVNGVGSVIMSTDDYFVGDARNPRDENGELDYETVEAVDVARLSQDLNALFGGKAIHARRFDFVRHDGYDEEGLTSIPDGSIVIVEGLHALNPRLVEGVGGEFGKFRIYIEPSTQPEIFAFTTLPSAHARLIRRLVRDNSFRKMNPRDTFRLWPKVLAGEEKWILPFRKYADAEFDSSLSYELAVLKPYVAGLLARVLIEDPSNETAVLLSNIMEAVHATDSTKVPGDSILRETIGGSQLDY